jgi:Zn-dependent peptidase ImmA (M78 family)/DNA-binding XRE family transcriptional regulator
MKEIVAKRIKSARTLAGLSLRELSQRMDGIVSHNAITKYENGLMMPDSKVLLALAKALDVKSDYFLRPYTVTVDSIAFRKKSKLSIKNLNYIQQKVSDEVEKYIEIEQFLNISSEFLKPVNHIKIRTGNDIEFAVNFLLEYWRLGSKALPNVIELLECNEIKVIEINADEDFKVLSGWANEIIPFIVINMNLSIESKRFIVLKELGHLLLNFDRTLENKTFEKLCNRFAGAMLINQGTMFNLLGRSRNNISQFELETIKASHGISVYEIMSRARDLSIINQDKFKAFRIWIDETEERRRETAFKQYVGREQSDRFKRLLYMATSEEFISMSKAANMANQDLATFRDEFISI